MFSEDGGRGSFGALESTVLKVEVVRERDWVGTCACRLEK